MIDSNLDTTNSILYVHPMTALSASDFQQLAKTVDPYIEKVGKLAGLIIETPSFPGWDGLTGMIAHFRFVHEHHKLIQKVALVTDSSVADIAERLASHFVSAKIKHFAAGELQSAQKWIRDNESEG